MIEYKRTGGLSGEETTIEITDDRKLFLCRKVSGKLIFDLEWEVEHSKWQRLVSLLEEVDFFSLMDDYSAPTQMIDGFTHALTVSIGDLTKTVITTTEGNAPSGFHMIVTQLEEIVKEAYDQKST